MQYHAMVAALAAVALAGCLGGGGADLQTTSARLIDEAREALGEDTELYGILGLEPNRTLSAADTDGCGEIPRATDPGRGNAQAWLYFYGSASTQESLLIVTNTHGDRLCEIKETLDSMVPNGQPLGKWSITSKEAARTIAENVEDYHERMQDADIHMLLARERGNPSWTFTAVGPEAYDISTWTVDATTGEYLGPSMFDGIPPVLHEGGQAHGEMLGTMIYTTNNPAEFTLEQRRHALLDLVVESQDPLADIGGQSYSVYIGMPHGESKSFTTTNGQIITIENPRSGPYTVAVFPVIAATADFTVTYCAYTDTQCSQDDDAGYLRKTMPGPWAPWIR